MVDLPGSAVGVEGLDGEGEDGDEGFEEGDEEGLGNIGDRAEVNRSRRAGRLGLPPGWGLRRWPMATGLGRVSLRL